MEKNYLKLKGIFSNNLFGRCMSSICFLFLMCSIATAQPILKIVGGNKFSFGKIYGDSRAVHKIKIRNEGNSPLIIKNITAACDCSIPKMSSDVIQPKRSATLSLTLITDGMDGLVNKSISIISNDSLQPVKVIWYSADVINLIEIYPNVLVFVDSQCVKGEYQILHLKNISQKKITILSIQDSTALTYNRFTKKLLLPNQSTDTQIYGMAVGSVSKMGIIKILTDSKLQPIIRVRYVIRGTGQ